MALKPRLVRFIKGVAIRTILVTSSVAMTYLVLEFLVFPHLILYLPLKTHWYLDGGIQVLAQYSKEKVVPEDYVALLGDS